MNPSTTCRLIALVVPALLGLAACSAGTDDGSIAETPTPSASASSDSPRGDAGTSSAHGGDTETMTDKTLHLAVGDTVLTATLADNSSAAALRDLLADGPVTVHMQDYENMEKVGTLPSRLPTNDEQITTEPGDLILYQGNKLVIYYAANSWSFTRLGKLDDVTRQELERTLGDGDVQVILSVE